MAVVIRMKQMGRKHRAYFRICATDSRSPRDGKFIEEIGTYDPMIRDTDARCTLKSDRVAYWLGVGAKPSEKCAVLIKKYGPTGTHLKEQAAAREKLSLPKIVAQPAVIPPKPEPAAPVAAATEASAEGAEAPAEAAAEASTES